MEKIIFINSCNEIELLRTLAKFNIKTLGYRVFSRIQLIQYIEQKIGKFASKKILNNQEEVLLYQKVLKENKLKYFENSTSYEDVIAIVNGINIIRNTSVNDIDDDIKSTLLSNQFSKKNEAILKLYDLYKKAKGDSFDQIDYIHFVLNNIGDIKLNLEIITLSSLKYNDLDKRIVDLVSDKHFNETQISINDLFNCKNNKGNINVYSVYGEYNEVLNVFKIINDNKYNVDECEIVLTDSKYYYPYLKEVSELLNVNMTFSFGYPLSLTKAGKLLENIYYYEKIDKFGVNGIKQVFLKSDLNIKKIKEELGIKSQLEFEKLLKVVGNLRLSFNKIDNENKINKFLALNDSDLTKDELVAKDFLSKFNTILIKGYKGIIEDYFEVKNSDEFLAKNVILNNLDIFKDDIVEYVSYILSKNIGSEASKEGYLHVTTLNNAFMSFRKNVFILGLSSDKFPTREKENFIALDLDIKSINSKARLSIDRQEEDINLYHQTMEFLNNSGCNVYLSYSNYDFVGVRERNKSSVLYDYDKVINIDKFFESNFFNEYGKSYLNSYKIYRKDRLIDNEEYEVNVEKLFNDENHYLSPSDLESIYLYKVENKVKINTEYDFFTKKILGINFENDADSYNFIEYNDFGTLVHSVFEKCKYPLNKKELEDEANRLLNIYTSTHYPINSGVKTSDKLLHQIRNGERILRNYIPVCKEEKLSGYINNLYFKGRTDLIASKGGVNYVIDYKTGKVKHSIKYDDNSVQGQLYAYLYNKSNKNKITQVEFAYFDKNATVDYKFDDILINNILDDFKDKVNNLKFEKLTYNPLIKLEKEGK